MTSPHVGDELSALLAGELDRETLRSVGRHLESCHECRLELVLTAVAHGSLVAARRAEEVVGYEPAPAQTDRASSTGTALPPLVTTSRRRTRFAGLAAAAAAVVGLLFATAAGAFDSSPHEPLVAMAHLHPSAQGRSASGAVMVHAKGDVMEMSVVTRGLAEAPPNHYYEVWLVQATSHKMMPVGVLAPSGEGRYSLTAPILDQFARVDISLQANNGDPRHSASVLEGQMTDLA